MLTINGTHEGKCKLTIPNQVVREQLYTYLLNTYNEANLSFSNYEKKMNYPARLLIEVPGKLILTI